MWQLVQANGQNADFNALNCISPTARTRHATCINQDGCIYLYGGKSGNMSLKDLWRFDTENSNWTEIKCTGDPPPCLEEHIMIAFNNKIYIFGGEVGYCSAETPLWQLNLDTLTWYKFGSVNTNSPGISSTQPTGRSGHSAVLFENALYIYGGYQQLKGSLSELWKFDLCTESWSLISGPCISTVQPPARYYHSAVIYGNQMYIYGGMNNLDAKSDFWRWNLIDKTWIKIKSNRGPGELHGHSAIKAFNCMFVFGGERNGSLLQELWRFNFDTENWDKIQTAGMLPSPRSKHTAISNPFIDLNTSWEASSSISSNNSNQSDSNRLSQCSNGENADDLETKSGSKSAKNEDAAFKNDKNKENKCDCNRSNEGTIRKFFRKKIGRSKLVRSVSTNSYNISHNENCNFHRSSSSANQSSSNSKSAMKKSNTCHEETIKSSQPTESRLMNSSTIESLSASLQDRDSACSTSTGGLTKSGISNSSQTLDKTDKNGKCTGLYSLQEEQSVVQQSSQEHRKYDIGQLSSLSSPSNEESEDLELFNKINQLQKELDSERQRLNGGAYKKQRPKSELIAGLVNLDEEYFDDSWRDVKYSSEQRKSYYSLSFPSPRYLPQNLSNKNLINEQKTGGQEAAGHLFGNNKVKIRDRVLASNGKPRPKTIHSSYTETDDFSEILRTPISYFDSDLNEINELESFNDEPFIREETMTILNGKESPMKSDEENVSNAVSKISNLNGKSLRTRNLVNNQQTTNHKISPTKTVTNSNTTTICSPMSTSSMMCSSTISKSLSQSSGYQSFMEDTVFDNNNANVSNNESNNYASNSSHTLVNHQAPVNHSSVNHQINHSHLNGEKNCQIKLRNQPNQLRLSNQTSKRYSCNISDFGSYDSAQRPPATDDQENGEQSPDHPKTDDQPKATSTSASTNFGHSVGKQIPNSSSNVEISLNGKVEHWERKMMVKTYSTNAFNGKDTIYSNAKNVQRTQGGSNSFLNLSDLIRKRKGKKKKKEYQFCMLVFGGNEKTSGNQAVQFSKQPIAVWKLYI